MLRRAQAEGVAIVIDVSCTHYKIFVISTPNNIPVQNLRGFCEIPHLLYTYPNPTKMMLRYKMDICYGTKWIFVFNTPESLLGEVWAKIFVLRFWSRTSRMVPFPILTHRRQSTSWRVVPRGTEAKF
ncbi:hypothetical protein Y032_0311g2139 [Ancylostoma ceylanicum]|nr:hypothetical protein Y032_0311g2139 [Ancylostoma ceylanicum]